MHRNTKQVMSYKETSRDSLGSVPRSSYPEAESEVSIFSPAARSALRSNQPPSLNARPIVSIYGHDVDEIPNTPGRAAA